MGPRPEPTAPTRRPRSLRPGRRALADPVPARPDWLAGLRRDAAPQPEHPGGRAVGAPVLRGTTCPRLGSSRPQRTVEVGGMGGLIRLYKKQAQLTPAGRLGCAARGAEPPAPAASKRRLGGHGDAPVNSAPYQSRERARRRELCQKSEPGRRSRGARRRCSGISGDHASRCH